MLQSLGEEDDKPEAETEETDNKHEIELVAQVKAVIEAGPVGLLQRLKELIAKEEGNAERGKAKSFGRVRSSKPRGRSGRRENVSDTRRRQRPEIKRKITSVSWVDRVRATKKPERTTDDLVEVGVGKGTTKR